MAFKHLLTAVVTVIMLGAAVALAVFDPVNDDTDIFLANPTIAAERPNVLLVIDNSANWNSPFDNEKNAMVQVINGLTDQYNVGLMIMSDSNIKRTGSGTDDGAYVRYHVRQMTTLNKSKLATIVANFDKSGDKGDNTLPGLALYEAYLYFSGKASRAGDDQSKVDFDGTTDPHLSPLTGHALPGSGTFPNVNSLYRSPVTDGCQRNFIIYISNGPANENSNARAALEGYLGTLTGVSPPAVITINPDGQQSNWADEMAKFAANADVLATSAGIPNSSGVQNIYTYTVEIDPASTPDIINVTTSTAHGFAVNDPVNISLTTNYNGTYTINAVQSTTQFSIKQAISPSPGPEIVGTATVGTTVKTITSISQSSSDMTALLKSMAANGKGKYFGVSSSASGTAIIDALNSIFAEVQAVNSVFASTTLPVSVNVRGTNLNQVYIGVFRPDPNKSPRWLGNLKMYNLALNSATRTVFLADAANGAPPAVGNAAENSATGFVGQTSPSFWTAPSAFWGFRTPEENGPGGSSDKPDGDQVEKGGAAQQLRIAFAVSQATRKLYTCTTGNVDGVLKTCAGNSALSDTPFTTLNSAITPASLQLDTRPVSPLSALQTKPVAALTDRLSVTLDNSDPVGSRAVSSLSNDGTTRTILTPDVNSPKLTTATPRVITSVTSDVPREVNVSSIAKVSGNVTVTAATGADLTGWSGTVVITGNSVGGYNGSWTISSLNVAARTFQINAPNNLAAGTGGVARNGVQASTTATVTLPAHGFTVLQTVTINGATPGEYNRSNAIVTSVPDTDHFTYAITKPGTTGNATGTITAAGNTTTATATTSTPHGLTVGTPVPNVTISGASDPAYNGPKTITPTGASTFTYSVGATAVGPNTNPTVYVTVGGSTTVTVTTVPAHGFANNDSVVISGSDIAGYNGTIPFPPGITVIDANRFSYTTATVLPANSSATVTASALGTTLATVTATATNHGFVAFDSVVIESTSSPPDAVHQGTFTVLPGPTANTFTYTTTVPLAAPVGSYTVRPLTLNSKAIVTVTGHGYGAAGSTKEVIISGASSAACLLPCTAYNGTKTATIVDANTFTFPMTTTPGANTSGSVTSAIKTTTARATAINHGFANGSVVSIAGASPSAFNSASGTDFTVTVVDANTFTYTLPSAQGAASGTILAAQATGSSTERDAIVNWVRGQDNFQDENLNTLATDARASIHGDVLHSRPAVVNYNRFSGSDDDVFVYYGGNDGIFHAVKGGYAVPAGDVSGLTPGQEAWGFVASEFFPNLRRLRNNSPTVSSAFKRPYFMDGPIGVLTQDNTVPPNGKLGDIVNVPSAATQPASDVVNLYIANRRGGRFVYALDVNTPTNPKFLWKISNATAGFGELGMTWSQPTVVTNLAGLSVPVLVFGAGYDAAVDDLDPASITAVNATTGHVTTAGGTISRTMGRGIFVVNALTGAPIWSAGGTGSGATTEIAGMVYAIPSDIALIRNESGGFTNRAYVGDTGGNVWRIDFQSDSSVASPNLALTTVTKLASLADPTTATGRRKFLFPPDVVGQQGFDAILLGSGDREHPFDTSVTNRFYMLKDRGGDVSGAVTGLPSTCDPTITEGSIVEPACTPNPIAGLSDLTSNCIQDASGCVSGETQAAVSAKLGTDRGWFITLASGEKVVGNAVSIGGTTFFNTNQPSSTAGGGTCGSNLGVARQYQVATADATATVDLNAVGGLTAADRSLIHAGGGYLPSPVHVVVRLDGQPVEAVISGIQVSTPPGASLSARLRKYWYREIDSP